MTEPRVSSSTAAGEPVLPSDHAAVTSALASTLLLAGMRGSGLAGLLGAFAIGTSRVIAGVHYPSDVLGGVLVGAVCATVSLRAQGSLRPALDVVLQVAQRLRPA